MKISREDVLRVAELAYLDLSETEIETYRAQIDEILEYIGKLNELDTAKVEPMAQVRAPEPVDHLVTQTRALIERYQWSQCCPRSSCWIWEFVLSLNFAWRR